MGPLTILGVVASPTPVVSVKAAAAAFRVNPKINTEKAILELGTGEALISFQNERGEPEIVERGLILPPQSYMGTIDDFTRNRMINQDDALIQKYGESIDKESAFEVLSAKNEEKRKAEEEERARIEEEKQKALEAKEEEKRLKQEEKERKEEERLAEKAKKEEEKRAKEEERAKKNSVGYKLGKKVVNSAENKVINKGLNALFKKLFK